MRVQYVRPCFSQTHTHTLPYTLARSHRQRQRPRSVVLELRNKEHSCCCCRRRCCCRSARATRRLYRCTATAAAVAAAALRHDCYGDATQPNLPNLQPLPRWRTGRCSPPLQYSRRNIALLRAGGGRACQRPAGGRCWAAAGDWLPRPQT